MSHEERNIKNVPISAITFGKRIQRNSGNIAGLAKNIQEHGLVNPITVADMEDGSYLLIAGYRRFLAVKQLGWTEIQADVVEAIPELTMWAMSDKPFVVSDITGPCLWVHDSEGLDTPCADSTEPNDAPSASNIIYLHRTPE